MKEFACNDFFWRGGGDGGGGGGGGGMARWSAGKHNNSVFRKFLSNYKHAFVRNCVIMLLVK